MKTVQEKVDPWWAYARVEEISVEAVLQQRPYYDADEDEGDAEGARIDAAEHRIHNREPHHRHNVPRRLCEEFYYIAVKHSYLLSQNGLVNQSSIFVPLQVLQLAFVSCCNLR